MLRISQQQKNNDARAKFLQQSPMLVRNFVLMHRTLYCASTKHGHAHNNNNNNKTPATEGQVKKQLGSTAFSDSALRLWKALQQTLEKMYFLKALKGSPTERKCTSSRLRKALPQRMYFLKALEGSPTERKCTSSRPWKALPQREGTSSRL